MDAYIEKLELIRWITELQDVSTLAKIRSIKENKSVLTDIELLSIEKGIDDFKQGKVRPHLQVKKRYEKWL